MYANRRYSNDLSIIPVESCRYVGYDKWCSCLIPAKTNTQVKTHDHLKTRSPSKGGTRRNARRLIRKLAAFRRERCSVSPTPITTTAKITVDSESPPTVWVNANICRISHHFPVINPFLHFGPVLRTFLYYLIAFSSIPDRARDAISGWFVGPLVLDKLVKFHDPSLSRSR